MKRIKKYSNRRLYDTDRSEYITLEGLADLIRDGHDVRVIDASSGDDLTQSVLAQIVVESRGAAKLLPVPLLTQMIRMEEDALAEFMSNYMSWALEIYFQAKRGFRDMNPYQLFGSAFPFNPGQALGRFFGPGAPWMGGQQSRPAPSAPSAPPPSTRRPAAPGEQVPAEQAPPRDAQAVDVDTLRRQIEALNNRLDELSRDDDEEHPG